MLIFVVVGIPNVRWYGTEGNFNILVMDLLGLSIEALFNQCRRRFSLKTVLMLADQMVHSDEYLLCDSFVLIFLSRARLQISRLEFVHNRNFIHRDIKPDNFVMGLGKKGNWVHLIDFGLSKRFRDPKTGQHLPYKDGKSLTGTVRYCSINTHMGIGTLCHRLLFFVLVLLFLVSVCLCGPTCFDLSI